MINIYACTCTEFLFFRLSLTFCHLNVCSVLYNIPDLSKHFCFIIVKLVIFKNLATPYFIVFLKL